MDNGCDMPSLPGVPSHTSMNQARYMKQSIDFAECSVARPLDNEWASRGSCSFHHSQRNIDAEGYREASTWYEPS